MRPGDRTNGPRGVAHRWNTTAGQLLVWLLPLGGVGFEDRRARGNRVRLRQLHKDLVVADVVTVREMPSQHVEGVVRLANGSVGVLLANEETGPGKSPTCKRSADLAADQRQRGSLPSRSGGYDRHCNRRRSLEACTQRLPPLRAHNHALTAQLRRRLATSLGYCPRRLRRGSRPAAQQLQWAD